MPRKILTGREYKEVISFISSRESCNDLVFQKQFLEKFKRFDDCSLKSILHQYQRRQNMSNTKKVESNIMTVASEYFKMANNEETDIFLKLSKVYKIAPVSIARILVEHLKLKKKVTRKFSAYELIKDPRLLGDGKLASEIYLASVADMSCGPISMITASLCGVEHEVLLQSYCEKAGLSFMTEKELAQNGYSKTPDILLNIPVGIDDQIVKWIESKALFIDSSGHISYLESQYRTYVTKFGPGLVIYWFGFVANIPKENNILIYDHFPTKIKLLSCLTQATVSEEARQKTTTMVLPEQINF